MWIWQKPEWPFFTYDVALLQTFETVFLHQSGRFFGAYCHLSKENQAALKIELITEEATTTSQIEGEYLDRNSIQSSLARQLGLITDNRRVSDAERGVASF